jgi:hypothetical protein
MKIKVTRLICEATRRFGQSCLSAWRAFGLGADYQNGQPVGGTSSWPEGLKELVNKTNRVHGYFVNAEDLFFFSGSATNFSEFLHDYAKIQGLKSIG